MNGRERRTRRDDPRGSLAWARGRRHIERSWRGLSEDAYADENSASSASAAASTSSADACLLYWSSRPLVVHPLVGSAVLLLVATPLGSSLMWSRLSTVLLIALRIAAVLVALLAYLHQRGTLKRFVLRLAASVLSEFANEAPIFISNAQIDLLAGKLTVQDLIVHNLERDAWEWDSPCLMRVGRIEARVSFASIICTFLGRLLNYTFYEVYSVLVEDVQVFVEKRKNVFNFHLLDERLEIPDPGPIMEEYRRTKRKKSRGGGGRRGLSPLEFSKSLRDMSKQTEEGRGGGGGGSVDSEHSSSDHPSERCDAAEGGEEGDASGEPSDKPLLFRQEGLTKIGEAINEGGSRAADTARVLHTAVLKQTRGLKDALHIHNNPEDSSSPSSSRGKRSTTIKAAARAVESCASDIKDAVERKVSDVSAKVSDVRGQVVLFKSMPEAKGESWVTGPWDVDDVRVGSILMRDVRTFMKDVIVTKGDKARGGDDAVNATKLLVSQAGGGGSGGGEGISLLDGSGSSATSPSSGWSKPVVIQKLAITGAELAPPASARDADGAPAVAITVERLVLVIARKVAGAVAKSNSGRLFLAAAGDMLSLVRDNAFAKED